MKSVIVNWTTEAKVIPNALAADHYVVGLGTTEANVALTERSHTFADVQPGSYSGWVTLCAADGSELAPPLVYGVEVSSDPTADVPVSVNAVAQ